MRSHRANCRLVGLVLLLLLAPCALAQSEAVPTFPENQRPAGQERTLLFVGDVMLARGVGAKLKSQGDWTYPFLKIADALRAADLAFANLESPVSDKGRNRHHLYSFRADPRAIEGLKFAGFDVVSVANNHAYDWGPEALLDTLERLRQAGIAPVGAGENDLAAHYPRIADLQGVKLAFLAYVDVEPKTAIAGPDKPGVAWLDADRVLADIRFARPLADLVIVSLHWGNEYATRPAKRQVELAHQMVEAGADLVVGSHPHVVQSLEQFAGGWIAYSLGNFVFDQKPGATRRGLMLKVKLRDKAIVEVATVPVTIEPTFQAAVTAPEDETRAVRRARRKAASSTARAQ